MITEEYKKSLRQKAEIKLARMTSQTGNLNKKQLQEMVEELNIHQIELEIQNEELQTIQKSLENSRYRYMKLFDEAPVGYCILDQVGLIKQFNTTFLKMVGENFKPGGSAFADLLAETDASQFRARYKAFLKSPKGKQIQARIARPGTGVTHVLIEARLHQEQKSTSENPNTNLMLTLTDITELQFARKGLKQALDLSDEKEREVSALLRGARAVLEQKSFDETARSLFDVCSETIGSTSGYVALMSDDGSENEVLFLEDGGLPCTVDPDLPMPIRGLREEAYRTGQVVYDNHFMESEWTEFLPEGHVHLENVMFAPLVINDKTVGVIGLANKTGGFNKNDADIARGFGELAAIALKNNRLQDKRDLAERAKENLIRELTDALDNVKTLSGLIPICSFCKKIRDDKGYWNQLEEYLDEHSDAQLSHGICQECSKKHYPDLDLYDD